MTKKSVDARRGRSRAASVPERKKTGAAPRVVRTAEVDPAAELGPDTVIGAFCYVAAGARVGAGTRIQSHTAVWAGVTLAEDVFVGPSAVFTNIKTPRADFPRAPHWDETFVGRGASIGANATLVAPLRVGARALVGAGAIVTREVPPHAVVIGAPARVVGWACTCGEVLARRRSPPTRALCKRCGRAFARTRDGRSIAER